MELSELHRRAVEQWQAVLDGVGQDQWASPTPCADWDVRALVNHVVGEELWTPPILDGATIEEVGDRFEGDVLGADPGTASRSAALQAVAAVDQRVPQGGTVQLSFGETPVEEYVRQLTADHLVHGWDLAAATDQDRAMDAEVVTEVATWFADREELYRSAGAVGPRGPAAEDPQGELLAGFGRDPSWGR
jgi:uncharacterized protein (TIGR03086 family)